MLIGKWGSVARLGINAKNQASYQGQFGISIRPPTTSPRPIDDAAPQNLTTDALVDPVPDPQPIDSNAALQAAMQTLVERAQADLNFQPGEFTMLTLDTPDVPNQSSLVMMARTNQQQASRTKPERIAGVCYVVSNVPEAKLERQSGVLPWGDVSAYFRQFEHRNINKSYGSVYPVDTTAAVIVQAPKHGELVATGKELVVNGFGEYRSWYYKPEEGYFGQDDAVIDGVVNGLKVKLHYYFHVLDTYAFTYSKVCGKGGDIWKISTDSPQPLDLASVQRNAALSALIANASQSLTGFQNLAGNAVGTTGEMGVSSNIPTFSIKC